VAFALGRALGPAVVRNRLRRRLRAACRTLDRTGSMPGGLLLIGANQTALELSFAQIESEMAAMMAELTTMRPGVTGTSAAPITTGPGTSAPADEPSA
jgi:ribonuclease P protein component